MNFVITVLFVLCCKLSYLSFLISSFMITIGHGTILKNVIVSEQSVNMTWAASRLQLSITAIVEHFQNNNDQP